MSASPAHGPGGYPQIAIVVAMTGKGVIGLEGRLPWDIPADRRLFRQLTEGNTVLMGHRTFASLGKPLPCRQNIVLSRTLAALPGAHLCRSFLEGLALGWRLGRPIYVIGGTEVYRKALPIADTLHISWISGDHAGDCTFPEFSLADWEVIGTIAHPDFRHVTYRRRRPL